MDTAFLDELADGVQTFQEAANSRDPERFNEAEQTYDNVLAEAHDHGMSRINSGGGRIVFRGGSVAGDQYVVKVEKFGAEENRDAVQTWQSMGEDAREHVAPIVAWADDYRWIIQRKAGAGVPGTTTEVLEALGELGWALADNNLENIGSLDGRPVVIDLGRLYAV